MPHEKRNAAFYADGVKHIRHMVDQYAKGQDLLTPAGWMCQHIVKELDLANKDELLAKLTEADQYQFRFIRAECITAKETRELLYEVLKQLESLVPADARKEQVVLPEGQVTLW